MRKSLLAVVCLALIAGSAFVTGTMIDSSPQAGAAVADSYFQCWQSYIQCVNDCQSFQEPTRSQCEYWCYSTHWCAQV